jgi:HSP90 family molecular chaperone
MVKNNQGRASKETKLYDYINSSARLRKMRDKIQKKLDLEELQRKEKAYFNKTWNDRNKLIVHQIYRHNSLLLCLTSRLHFPTTVLNEVISLSNLELIAIEPPLYSSIFLVCTSIRLCSLAK